MREDGTTGADGGAPADEAPPRRTRRRAAGRALRKALAWVADRVGFLLP